MPGFHVIQKMINGMTVSRWACINFSRSVQESVARGFCGELAQMCQVSGMVNVIILQYSAPTFMFFMFKNKNSGYTILSNFLLFCRNFILNL